MVVIGFLTGDPCLNIISFRDEKLELTTPQTMKLIQLSAARPVFN
jgi:hypothetical protein